MRGQVSLCTLGLYLFLATVALAVPAPAPVTTSVQDGQQVTFVGTGFGLKSPAAPWKWDNFESGTPGQTVGNGWSVYSQYGGQIPTYTTDKQRTAGSISTLQGPEGNSSISVAGFPGSGNAQLYISGWFFGTKTGNSRSNKFMNFNGGSWTHPEIRSGGDSWYWSDTVACDTGGTSPMGPNGNGIPDPYNTGQWHRWEWYIQLGSNGTFNTYRDGVLEASGTGNFSFGGCNFNTVYMSSYWGQMEGGLPKTYHSAYWDELYLDVTRARVELGNASTFGASTHREVQIPTAWSDGSVTVRINQGSFPDQSTVYLYVVDQNGAVNQNGQPVNLGSGGDNSPTVQILTPVPSGGTYSVPETVGTLVITGTAEANLGISTIAWSNDGTLESGTVENVSGDWTSWRLTGIHLELGVNAITFQVRNTADQVGTNSIVLTRGFDYPAAPGQPDIQ